MCLLYKRFRIESRKDYFIFVIFAKSHQKLGYDYNLLPWKVIYGASEHGKREVGQEQNEAKDET